MLTFDDIHRLLEAHRPLLMPRDHRTHAAVALILRTSPSGADMLFIERAHHHADPWSGNLGFPGGKVEEFDGEVRRTAERETLEEIGLDLGRARCLGRLSDIAGAHLPVRISCFVYGIEGPITFRAGDEVRNFFWIPFDHLLDPERHLTARVRFSGRALASPAIRILESGCTPLWGITYRLVMQFLGVLGCSPSPTTVPGDFLPGNSEK